MVVKKLKESMGTAFSKEVTRKREVNDKRK